MESFKVNELQDFLIRMRNEYKNRFGKDKLTVEMSVDETNPNKQITAPQRWAEELGGEYADILSCLDTKQYGTYVLFHYKQLGTFTFDSEKYGNADFWDAFNGLFRCCRSTVIDISDDLCEIVLRPFDKFFNMNERPETEQKAIEEMMMNRTSVEFSDKMDGSMISARWYKNLLVVSSSKELDPERSWRVKMAKKMILADENIMNLLKKYDDFTAIFELIVPEDPHVVQYDYSKDKGLYLITLRNNLYGYCIHYSVINGKIKDEFHIGHCVCYYDTITFNDVLTSLSKYKSYEKEGYVMMIDGEFFVKIKCQDYVQMHGVVGALTSINLTISHIADNTFDDFYASIPEAYKPRIKKLADYILDWIAKQKEYVDKEAEKILNMFPDRKSRFIYIEERSMEYGSLIRSWVITKVLGNEPNYLKLRSGKVLKLKDMGIPEEQYKSFIGGWATEGDGDDDDE